MLRKDLFFFGTSAEFKAVCEDVSFDVGVESALAVGDSVDAVVGLVGLGTCEESVHCPVGNGARQTHAWHWKELGCASG
jgi:hypothetical protein